MNLTPAQQKTYDDMLNAPDYKGEHHWSDTHKRCDGLINGNWNTHTLKAMERKGVIRVIEYGNWWNDTVELLEG